MNSETGGRLRLFNGVGAKLTPTATTTFARANSTSARIENADESLDNSTWYGLTAIGKFQFTPAVAVVGRFERYDDEDQVNIATGLVLPFRATAHRSGST